MFKLLCSLVTFAALGLIALGIIFFVYTWQILGLRSTGPSPSSAVPQIDDAIITLAIYGGVSLVIGMGSFAWRSRTARMVLSLWKDLPLPGHESFGNLVQAVSEEPRLYKIGLYVVTAIGTLIKIAFIGQPIRYDEALTYYFFASRPLSEGLSNYTVPNNHLLNTLMIHLATQLGHQECFIRLPAFIAGVG